MRTTLTTRLLKVDAGVRNHIMLTNRGYIDMDGTGNETTCYASLAGEYITSNPIQNIDSGIRTSKHSAMFQSASGMRNFEEKN